MYLKKPAVMGLCVVFAFAGCAHHRPPERVVNAIHTMNLYAPEYVRESNKALEQTQHPDAERLCGIGERLADALNALDRWAANQETADESR